jgi:rsbT co-antagonist protein RsbR
MQVALAGTSLRGLEVLILDVTGVADVDAGVAERLIAVVRAVELLGAEVVVTGIRGEVARRLVSLDIDFGTKVKTRSTLHAGITHAFQRSRRARGGAGSS